MNASDNNQYISPLKFLNMKQTLQKLWIFIILGSFNQLLAQDLHFTQYEFTPIHVNPANTGGF